MIKQETIDRIIKFRNDRNWAKFHTIKDLILGIKKRQGLLSLPVSGSNPLDCAYRSSYPYIVASPQSSSLFHLTVIIYEKYRIKSIFEALDILIKHYIKE